jgi:Tfp pilus assembly protein PilF
MMLTILLPLALLVATVQGGTIQQMSTGWCSPNIANVSGSVTVNCIGVDPRAIKVLNAKLDKKNVELSEKIREANEWASRYHELETRLSEASQDTALSKKAEEYLHKGDLEKAGATLDQILKNEENQIDQTAANQYNRGLIFQLQFLPLDALPHFEKAYRYRPDVWKYANQYGKSLLVQNSFSLALSPLEHALQVARFASKDGQPLSQRNVVSSLELLAVLHRDSGQFPAANSEYDESIMILRALEKQNPGGSIVDLAEALNSRAVLYAKSGQINKASGDLTESYRIYEALAKSDPDNFSGSLATSVMNISNYYDLIGKKEDAEAGYELSLSIFKRLADRNPAYLSELGGADNNIGSFYLENDRLEEAKTALSDSVNIFQQLSANNPEQFKPELSQALENLGVLFRKLHENGKAKEVLLQSLKIRRDLAEKYPDAFSSILAESLNSVGVLSATMAETKDAETYFLEAIRIRRQLVVRSPDGLDVKLANYLENLGHLYRDTERVQDAEPLYSELVGIDRRLAKSDPLKFNSDLLIALQMLASLHTSLNRYDQAEAGYQEALELCSHMQNPSDESMQSIRADILGALGDLYFDTDRVAKALPMYDDEVRTLRTILTKGAVRKVPALAEALNHRGSAYGSTGQFQAAKADFTESLALYTELDLESPGKYRDGIKANRQNLELIENPNAKPD